MHEEEFLCFNTARQPRIYKRNSIFSRIMLLISMSRVAVYVGIQDRKGLGENDVETFY